MQKSAGDLYRFLDTQVQDLVDTVKDELLQNYEYHHNYGPYWLFEDRLSRLEDKSENTIIKKDAAFRRAHMQIKDMVHKANKDMLISTLFPTYQSIKERMKEERRMRRLTGIPSIELLENFHSKIEGLKA